MNTLKANLPYGTSLAGKIRRHNEDSFLYTDDPAWSNQLAIVADGIGGNMHGEVASRLCCQYFFDIWMAKKAMFFDDAEEMEHFMLDCIREVNEKIFRLNCESDFLETHMGTTVVAAAIMPKDIIIAHAGDSRFYDFRANGKLACLTTDHTLVQKRKDLAGKLANSKKNVADLCNFITKSVGTSDHINDDPKAPLINSIKRRSSSRYLLCSDGLTHMVDNENISTILRNTPDNRNAVNKLIGACFAAGATDNISIIIF